MSFSFGGDPILRNRTTSQVSQPTAPTTTMADLYSYLPQQDQLALTGTATNYRGSTFQSVPVAAPTLSVAPTVSGTKDLMNAGLSGASYLGGGPGGYSYVPPVDTTADTSSNTNTSSNTSTNSNTGSTSTPGTQTNATAQATQTASNLDLGGLTAQEISAMLDYISAQTGLTIAQLSQQAGALGDAARQMMAAIQRQYGLDIGSTEADALRRGIFHSGILARNVGRVGEARGLQEGQVRSQAAGKLSDLQLALNSLVAQNQLSAAQAGSDILKSNLDVGQQAALQNRLGELNLGAIPNVDLGQIANQAAGYSLV